MIIELCLENYCWRVNNWRDQPSDSDNDGDDDTNLERSELSKVLSLINVCYMSAKRYSEKILSSLISFAKWYVYALNAEQSKTSTFKYHVSCTDGKISVRIILITYFSTVVPFTSCVYFPVGLFRKENTTCEWDDGGKIGN